MIEGAKRIELAVGDLAFTAWEMGEGPLALCLHGFPDTPATWRHLLPDLARAGYRAVAVTSRGYEPSSQPPDSDYSLAALSEDVIGWLDALGADRAHLIGHDWGSSILHLAAARAPERALTLTALAVPHPAGFAQALAGDFEQLARSWYIYFFQQPAADLVVAQDDFAFLEFLWRRWSPDWTPPAEDLAHLRSVFAQEGVVAAALAYYRTAFDLTHGRLAETAALAGQPIQASTLALHGSGDGCIGAATFRRALAPGLYAASLQVETVPEAGHFLHLERPHAVNAVILDWLGR